MSKIYGLYLFLFFFLFGTPSFGVQGLPKDRESRVGGLAAGWFPAVVRYGPRAED